MRVPRSFLPVCPSVSSLTPAAWDSTRPSGWRPHLSRPPETTRGCGPCSPRLRSEDLGSGVLQALKKLKWRRWCAGPRRGGSRGPGGRRTLPIPEPSACRAPGSWGRPRAIGWAGWGPASAATRGKGRELLERGPRPPWCHGIFLSQMHGHLGSRHDDRLQRGVCVSPKRGKNRRVGGSSAIGVGSGNRSQRSGSTCTSRVQNYIPRGVC